MCKYIYFYNSSVRLDDIAIVLIFPTINSWAWQHFNYKEQLQRQLRLPSAIVEVLQRI